LKHAQKRTESKSSLLPSLNYTVFTSAVQSHVFL